MKVCALYNSKGGVGKSTIAVNLAFLSAKEGLKTLLWDLDPQGAASFFLDVDGKVDSDSAESVSHREAFDSSITVTGYDNLDIIPADFSLRNLDVLLDELKNSRHMIEKQIASGAANYDVVFIDSPPGLSLLAENLFLGCDYILLPMIPTYLSLRSYMQISAYFSEGNFEAGKLIPFFSMVDTRKKMHRDIIREYHAQGEFLSVYIPESSVIEKMSHRKKPLPAYSTVHPASRSFYDLWAEIKKRIYLS
ncbi:ParA family protein [Spirochaetia bacterium 38H-sp]|uniref:ParA family protein n=1 Tax=Rarispira pelagica TaxID=3141764 RepID=A0ABU9U8W1_9SPIR